jgi:hypothetical protein
MICKAIYRKLRLTTETPFKTGDDHMCSGRVAVHVPLIAPSYYCCYKPGDKS